MKNRIKLHLPDTEEHSGHGDNGDTTPEVTVAVQERPSCGGCFFWSKLTGPSMDLSNPTGRCEGAPPTPMATPQGVVFALPMVRDIHPCCAFWAPREAMENAPEDIG